MIKKIIIGLYDLLGLPYYAAVNLFKGLIFTVKKTYKGLMVSAKFTFKNIVKFLNLDFADFEIAEAVEFTDFASMKKREAQNFYKGDFRVSTDDPTDENTYKTRRGLIGGYTDYFTEAQTANLERTVSENLNPVFGY